MEFLGQLATQRTFETLLSTQIYLLRLRNLLQDILDDNAVVYANITVSFRLRRTLVLNGDGHALE